MWNNDRPTGSKVGPLSISVSSNLNNDDIQNKVEPFAGPSSGQITTGAIASSSVSQLSSQQPQSSQSTLERVVNNQPTGATSQPSILPSTATTTIPPKVMNSHVQDSSRANQHVPSLPKQQSRDVTRVVKILKQNEPLVRTSYAL